MQTKRIFIAAEFPQEVIQSVYAIVKENWPSLNQGIRWAPIHQYHLTLKFIGDTPVEEIPDIQEKCKALLHPQRNFPLTITGFGVFPNLQKPTVLWAGIHNAETLIDFQKLIEHELQTLGIPAERRPFQPHLTLARIKPYFPENQMAALLAPVKTNKELLLFETSIRQITLFESKLTGQGAIYKTIATLSPI